MNIQNKQNEHMLLMSSNCSTCKKRNKVLFWLSHRQKITISISLTTVGGFFAPVLCIQDFQYERVINLIQKKLPLKIIDPKIFSRSET